MTKIGKGPVPSDQHGSSAFLSVRDLKVHFPSSDGIVKATDGLSFDLERGKTLGIVGESGSGKSVSSSAIMGLHKGSSAQISGEIIFNGEDLLKLSEQEMRKRRGRDVAMIFQDPLSAMHPYYTVGNQIMEAYQVHNNVTKREARKRAIEMLDRVGIPQPDRRVDDYPHQFSGGMRQRAMIAMGLINNPSLLIADEPTTALDVTIQARILELIADLQQRHGTSVLYISHDLSLVRQMCDRVAVMYAGRIVETGHTGAVFTDPLHPYTRGLMAAVPSASQKRGELLAIEGNVPEMVDPTPCCRFHTRCRFAVDLCRQIDPELLDIRDHGVACLAYASAARLGVPETSLPLVEGTSR